MGLELPSYLHVRISYLLVFDTHIRHGLLTDTASDCAPRHLVIHRTIADLGNYVEHDLVGKRFAEVVPCPDQPCRSHLDPVAQTALCEITNQVS